LIIAHAVWLYFRFPLSLRLVEEMLLERGILVSYETVRRWALKFGPAYARRLKRKTPSRRDIWHFDEVVVTISGKKHWLWRAVDQDGYVLDEIVQSRRDTKAAKRLLKRLLRKQGCPPRRMITDKLGSYAAARRQVMPDVEHRTHKGLNNRAENSHLPFRRRERAMQGVECPGTCSGSSVSSLPFAIFSFHLAPAAPPLPPICTASTPWRNGKLRPTMLLELVRRPNRPEGRLLAVNVTTPERSPGAIKHNRSTTPHHPLTRMSLR
jgi:putative transposase